MADDKKPGDPFHSGHTVVLGAKEEAKPAPVPGVPSSGPQTAGARRPSEWGAKTMALPAEAFDGLEGLPPLKGASGGGGGTHGGKTMALDAPPGYNPPPMPGGGGGGGYGGPGGGYGGPGGGGGGYGGPGGGGGGYGGPGGGGGGAAPAKPKGSVPYLETQAIDPSTYLGQQEAARQAAAQQQYQPPPPQYQAPPPQYPPPPRGPAPSYSDEPIKTTLLDSSKIDPSAYGAPKPSYAPPPQAPPPAGPASFDANGLALGGQKTVMIRPDQMAAMAPAAAAMPAAAKGKLIIFVVDTDPIVFDLMPGMTTVGRGMENHLVLGDPYASRKHSVITAKDGSYIFEDTGSDNGTMINGARSPGKVLQTGDVIEIGSVLMRFVAGEARPEHYKRPQASAGGGAVAVKPKRKKKASTAQLAILIFLVVATIGLIVVGVMIYLKKQ